MSTGLAIGEINTNSMSRRNCLGMRTVDFEWSEHFAPHILARGKKYFEEGHINRIQRINNTCIADVEGTYEYEVEITIEAGSIAFYEDSIG